MKRTFGFFISVLFYLVGFAGLMYLILWIGNFIPINQMGEPQTRNIGLTLLINFGIVAVFGIQHSVMARKNFKETWTKIVPKHLERSLYVLISGFLCVGIALFWSPIDGTLWQLEAGSIGYYVMYGIFFLGIAVLLASTFLINHFELFGLQQAYLHMMKRNARRPRFTTFALYKMVRHPIYLGLSMIFWATPTMSMTHFLLATLFTAYIFVGIYFEEKDLIKEYGKLYEEYRTQVPSLVPFTKFGAKNTATVNETRVGNIS
ncbi:MAG: isoprenylcysteine carboxylmethyltransferase family protein [Lewinellaceae bacterium]|nr:isoprenylcysteine carboxylmethyltransferase family protein [Lewinellaceae bacterium]HPQ99903.1 methyltransferase [Saprospiraceae bacterium]HQU51509.1 methyltransferase [Saprospiraceae bacterium]